MNKLSIINTIIIIILYLLISKKINYNIIKTYNNNIPNTNIPKNIYMCFKHKNIPDKVINNWKKLNPGYNIYLFNDDECIDFLRTYYSQEYANFFKKIPHGAIKADFWRLCVLYKYGGIYSDIDIHPYIPIKNYLEDNVTYCTCIDYPKNNTFQALIMSTKKNPILKKCIDKLYSKKNYDLNDYNSMKGTTDMYEVLQEYLGNNIEGNKVYNIKNQKIQLLQEQTEGSWDQCEVFYNDKKICRSRYIDYDSSKQEFK